MNKKELDQATLMLLLEKGFISKEDIKKLVTKPVEEGNALKIKKSIDQFVNYLNNEYSINTRNGYKSDVEKFYKFIYQVQNIEELDEDKNIPNLSKYDISRFLTYLKISEYSPASIRRFKNSLVKYFDFIALQGHEQIQINDIEIPKEKKEDIFILRDDEIKAMSNCANELRDKLLILFMYETGMRRQELINCKKEHINLNRKTVKIYNGKKFDRVGYFTSEVKSMTLQYIEEWKETVNIINKKRSLRVKNKGGIYRELKISEFLFQTPRSEQISYSTIFKVIKDTGFKYYMKMLEKDNDNLDLIKDIANNKVENINTETLRHSKRAYLFSIGKSIEEVQVIMGDENRWNVKRYLRMAQKLYPETFR